MTSLLLLIATGVLALRSETRIELFNFSYEWYATPNDWHSRGLGVVSDRGTLRFFLAANDFNLRHPERIVVDGDRPGWVDEFRREHPSGIDADYSTTDWREIEKELEDTYGAQFELHPPDSFKFNVDESQNSGRWDKRVDLTLPDWVVAILFAVMPIVRLHVFVKKRRRRRANRCLECGYDLRASKDKCPECGANKGSKKYDESVRQA